MEMCEDLSVHGHLYLYSHSICLHIYLVLAYLPITRHLRFNPSTSPSVCPSIHDHQHLHND